jgi:hypothetical protein
MKKVMPLKIEPELIDRLKKLAEKDKRNLNNYVELSLEAHADREEKKKPR